MNFRSQKTLLVNQFLISDLEIKTFFNVGRKDAPQHMEKGLLQDVRTIKQCHVYITPAKLS